MLENGRIKVPVGIIVHTRQHLNNALAQDRYFFVDVARDGIALYQDDDKPLPRPRPRTAASELEMAREYFDEWFAGAGAFYDAFEINLGRGSTKNAAFHQIGRAHVCTPVTNAYLVCRLPFDKKTNI